MRTNPKNKDTIYEKNDTCVLLAKKVINHNLFKYLTIYEFFYKNMISYIAFIGPYASHVLIR